MSELFLASLGGFILGSLLVMRHQGIPLSAFRRRKKRVQIVNQLPLDFGLDSWRVPKRKP